MGLIDNADAAPVAFPKLLWKYYLDYLWYYESGSWVAKTANTARILAILVALPIIILSLLDISSYGIARTLGVIDDVKASTSDITSIHDDQATVEGSVFDNLSHTAETDSTASPLRSDEETYSVLPATITADVFAEESALEDQQHATHNIKLNGSSQSLGSRAVRAASNTRELVSNSGGDLYQRHVTKTEYDP